MTPNLPHSAKIISDEGDPDRTRKPSLRLIYSGFMDVTSAERDETRVLRPNFCCSPSFPLKPIRNCSDRMCSVGNKQVRCIFIRLTVVPTNVNRVTSCERIFSWCCSSSGGGALPDFVVPRKICFKHRAKMKILPP